MSVQLIVFPQYFDGTGPLSSPSSELVVDGIDFDTVNLSSSTQSISGPLPQDFVDTYTFVSLVSLFAVNTWYRFSGVASEIDESSGAINFSPDEGIVQRLSSLIFGATYDLTLNITSNSTNLVIYQYKANSLKSTHTVTGTGLQTISFNAHSTSDVIVIYSVNSTAVIEKISCNISLSTPSGVFTDLSNGQVICDLYEDEDIPLSLSVDDFKNVAEKVQSYSKAFNLPATKRNNQIFDNIFEVTRTDNGINFNAYKKTKAILKQDGFLLFEGYLRLIDIQDKQGEISYNVNLYSEVIALADVLGERTFNDISFNELEHDYTYSEIRNSWQGMLGLTSPLPVGTFAGTAGASVTGVLRYPFVDWTHQFTEDSNGPVLPRLESAFRPFLQLKYLIDRIFAATDFSYESAFFNTADFGNLFMDFNWGDNENGSQPDVSDYFKRADSQGSDYFINETSYNSASKLRFDVGVAGPATYWDNTNYKFTSPVNNLELTINYDILLFNTSGSSAYSNNVRVAKFDQYGNALEVLAFDNSSIASTSSKVFSGVVSTELQAGEYIQAQSKVITDDKIRMTTSGTASSLTFFPTNNAMQTHILKNALRGELGQWDFLKGLITMFNLVTVPDANNPSNILKG